LDAADYGVPQRRRRLIYLAGRGHEIDFAPKSNGKRTVRDVIGDMPPAGNSGDPIHDLSEKRSHRIVELIKKIPKNGGSRKDLLESEQLQCHKKCDGFKDVYGRMAWEEVAPTLTSGCFNPSKGRFLHPEEHRAITMREAALLQGFPKRYKFPKVTNKSSIALLIGNALPPEFIRRHALGIRALLEANQIR
jgi:DNA (cytosine-5)-methyltransferase 1